MNSQRFTPVPDPVFSRGGHHVNRGLLFLEFVDLLQSIGTDNLRQAVPGIIGSALAKLSEGFSAKKWINVRSLATQLGVNPSLNANKAGVS